MTLSAVQKAPSGSGSGNGKKRGRPISATEQPQVLADIGRGVGAGGLDVGDVAAQRRTRPAVSMPLSATSTAPSSARVHKAKKGPEAGRRCRHRAFKSGSYRRYRRQRLMLVPTEV
jgi:hypothetical protein